MWCKFGHVTPSKSGATKPTYSTVRTGVPRSHEPPPSTEPYSQGRMATVGPCGGAVSYERGTPVLLLDFDSTWPSWSGSHTLHGCRPPRYVATMLKQVEVKVF